MNVLNIIKNLHPSLSLSSEGFDYHNWMKTGSCINLIFLDMDFGHLMQSRFEDFCWLLIFWLDHVIVSRSHSTRDSSLDSTAVQHSTAVPSTVQCSGQLCPTQSVNSTPPQWDSVAMWQSVSEQRYRQTGLSRITAFISARIKNQSDPVTWVLREPFPWLWYYSTRFTMFTSSQKL